jgi:hypothetical protein
MKFLTFVLLTVMLMITVSCSTKSDSIEKWSVFEKEFHAEFTGNPFKDVEFFGIFTKGEIEMKIRGFYDGGQTYKIRFMPVDTGTWNYKTESSLPALNELTGIFECIEPTGKNYGPVKVTNRYYFEYAEGMPYYQVGTTAYAWNHQGDSLENITLETLSKSPFNKIRMCVFPKSYVYNENEPEFYIFERDSLGNHDYTRFSPEFFHHLEKRLLQLMELGIEADLILFHPYDRWGYQSMPDTTDQFYLEYLIARLASFRNIWWSAANEFDFMQSKTMDDWHRFFEILMHEDPYGHLRSIHNGFEMYDHNKPWITHASLQTTHFDSAATWRERWKKPLVYDECRYEGDIPQGWGNMSGKEMTAMFWKSLVTGTYAGQGECYLHPDDILWWSKGGELQGSSPERIAFFKTFLEDTPEEGFDTFGENFGGRFGEQYIWYFENDPPETLESELPSDIEFRTEIIDTWNMDIIEEGKKLSGKFSLELPQQPGIAIRFTKNKVIFPVKKVEIANDGSLFYESIRVDFIHYDKENIRYTLDGSEPGPESEKYRGPLEFSENTTLKVIALGENGTSPVNTIEFRKAVLLEPVKINKPEPGFSWKSYTGEWIQLPDFNRMRPFAKGKTQEISLDMAPSEDYFGLVFTGYLMIPEDEVYTFYAVSDDGSAIYVDNKLVTLNDGQHGVKEEKAQVGLEKGLHKIEVHYFDNWYDEALEIYVSSAKLKKTKIETLILK